ncbi:MAG TPA: MFS transporter [Rhodospirillales bacterium]|jgi:sugar phosphate permease|nr:MFS transporter [Rhodospirillales bacterium]
MIIVRVFVPFAIGFFVSYLYRSVNAVIAPNLIAEVGLRPADLGLLTGVYFLAFALTQVPLGVLLDRYGPRRPEATLLVVAGGGAFLFAAAEGAPSLFVGRALIGVGVSACLMAGIKAFVIWFPPERRALANGCLTAFGGLGALAATAPVEAALGLTDWRGVFLGLGAFTLAIAAVVYWVVPERPGSQSPSTWRAQIAGVGEVFTSRAFWRLAPIAAATQAAFYAIQSLWAGPWLHDVADLGRAAVADTLLFMAAAMVIGFIILGAAVERLRRLGVTPLAFAVTCMVAFMAVQAAMAWPWLGSVALLLVLFGLAGSSWVLPFAVMPASFAPELAGRVITGLNVLNFVAAFLAQWGAGVVIGLWPANAEGGYPLAAYQTTFAVMLALQFVCLVWFFVAGRPGARI